jgi:hypothetical protein
MSSAYTDAGEAPMSTGLRIVSRYARKSGREERRMSDLPTASKEGGGYAYDPKTRSISPNHVEFVITSGHKTFTVEKGEERTIHRAGDLIVVTTRDNLIVITCMYSHED